MPSRYFCHSNLESSTCPRHSLLQVIQQQSAVYTHKTPPVHLYQELINMPSTFISITELPTITQLYKLNRLYPVSSPSLPPSKRLNDMISLVRHDITKLLDVDCIVNAANSSLLGGGGVDGAIHRAAGRMLQKECAELDGCETGDAKTTSAYNLPCRWVIHTVGPVYSSACRRSESLPEKLLRSCYRRCLEQAVSKKARSVAFPAISTGVYGYPKDSAAFIALDETRSFLESAEGCDGGSIGMLERVVFCNFEEEDEFAYEEAIPYIFPPAEQNCPSTSAPQPDGESQEASPALLGSVDAPHTTTDSASEEQPPGPNGWIVNVEDIEQGVEQLAVSVSPKASVKSDDDWEEVRAPVYAHAERFDDESGEVESLPSTTGVQSMQSSGIISAAASYSTETG
ncbi:hypothetical protein BDV59DRAFT_170360 [Aspergillus ambiguus]|uniref:macro domain-containing protein n=1 Tax=Aspergillus ambiguus TaxID=176160 RepID=UPI003CCDED27